MKTTIVLALVILFITDLHSQEERIIPPYETSLGLGIGNAYGNIGLNLEYHIIDYFGVFAGIGVANTALSHLATYTPIPANFKINIPIGLRIYPLPDAQLFRPRLNLSYGINGYKAYLKVLENGAIAGKYTTISQGLSAGIGTRLMIGIEKNFAIDLDVNWAFTQKPWADVIPRSSELKNEDKPLTYSLGFSCDFNLFR